jgi:hypothetical protein
MYKKFICLTFMLLILSITSTSMAELVAYYSMDEGAGTLVADGSGKGHDGTITSTPTWGAGHAGTAVQFGAGGGSGVVNCGNWDTTGGTGTFTVAMWIKFAPTATYTQYQGIICNRNSNTDQYWGVEMSYTSGATANSVYFGAAGMTGGATSYGITTMTVGTWYHFALSFDGTRVTVYRDGVQVATNTTPRYATTPNKNSMVRIGGSEETSNFFQGAIDEVYIFNQILALADIVKIQNGEMQPAPISPGAAKIPAPGNKTDEISIDVGKLSWRPGGYIEAQNGTHNVFFGTDEASVTNATVANPLGTTVFQDLVDDNNSVALDRLEYATTYFWRVDEVNNPASSGTTKGFIWNFKTELGGYKILPASIKNVTSFGAVYPDEPDRQDPNSTCTGAGLDANDMHGTNMKTMWLGMDEGAYLQYEFDKAYKLYDMLVWNYNEEAPNNEYFGAKDVKVEYSLDGVNWTEVNDVPEFAMATGTNKCVANTDVMFGGVAAKYVKLTFLTGWGDLGLYGISEVRFSAEPTRAQNPVPANAATGVSVQPVLSWKVGRYSVDHNVYISTDVNAVKGGTASMVTRSDANYAPALALTKTYYWRVDEVNNAEAYPVWDGLVWSFSTATTIIVDNFETGYGATDVNFVWARWKDGFEVPANGGSEIGKGIDPPGLSTVFRSGTRSLVVSYNNSGANTFSQITAQPIKLPINTADLSIGSPTALVIYFRGEPNNVPAQMYAKINNAKVLYTGDSGVMSQSVWRPFVIDLSTINTTLNNVSSITIGFENIGTQVGIGNIYIDDIALYGVAPVVVTTAVNPGNTGLIASYSMENNVNDGSGKGLNGTIIGTPTYEQGAAGYGKALKFNGTTDCVDLGNKAEFNPAGSFSVSLWAKISTWSTGWGHVMVANRGETVGWQIRRYSSNRLSFTTRGISNDDTYSTANPPPLNEWINITCVYDSDAFTKTIYLDGAFDRSVNLTGTVKTITATTHNTYIGARANSGNTGQESFYTGLIDQVRLYNRALSAGETLYLADPTP